MRYDERGRPVTISAADSYELFWDDSDRLIAVQINFGSSRGGLTWARWHYHYAGRTLIAATRELSSSSVKRFWAATDERGLVYRLTDEQGATYWQSRWDATGWRTFIGQPQPEMWFPFGLPGQIILGPTRVTGSSGAVLQDGTEAYASGAGGTWTRPPVALNQWRAYDPYMGAFLQPDPADPDGRMGPEGYAYAFNSPVNAADPRGDRGRSQLIRRGLPSGWGYHFGDSNCLMRKTEIENAIDQAWTDVSNCRLGTCGEAGGAGSNFRRQWIAALLTGT